LVAAGHAERLKVEPKPAGWLLNRVGLYLFGRARFAEVRAAVERALTIIEALSGPDHPTVAIRNNNVRVNSWVAMTQGSAPLASWDADQVAEVVADLQLGVRERTSRLPTMPTPVSPSAG
jgi:hypothetical protein